MKEECAVCKRPAVVAAKVYKDNRSMVVPLCQPCLMRLSQKTRVEIVDMQSSTSEEKTESHQIQQKQIPKKPSKTMSKKTIPIIAFAFVLLVAVVGAICFFGPALINTFQPQSDTMYLKEDTNKDFNTTSNVTASNSLEMTPEEIYRYASVATVEINAIGSDFISTGTGFFCDTDKYLVTNYHVIEGAHEAYITIHDGGRYDITGIYGYDANLDIALLETNYKPDTVLNSNEKEVSTGESVYVIGSSEGLTSSFSSGIVSSAQRTAGDIDYIQITAPISHGNSGGPVLNSKGEVIGISTLSIVDGQNLNFAISINTVTQIKHNEVTNLLSDIERSIDDNEYETVYNSLQNLIIALGNKAVSPLNFIGTEYIYNYSDPFDRYNIKISANSDDIRFYYDINDTTINVHTSLLLTIRPDRSASFVAGQRSIDPFDPIWDSYCHTQVDHIAITNNHLDHNCPGVDSAIVDKYLDNLMAAISDLFVYIGFPYTLLDFGFIN